MRWKHHRREASLFRIILIVVILAAAGWIGKNLHDGRPWYSNPFASEHATKALVDQAGERASQALGSGLEAVGEGGKKVAEGIEQASEAAIEKGEQLKH